MQNELMTPINHIIAATQHLRDEATINLAQERLLTAIAHVAGEMRTLILAIPDPNWDKAREVLSFEARGYLASIIGYAEMLLDEDDGTLNTDQIQYAHQIRANGKSLLARLIKLEA